MEHRGRLSEAHLITHFPYKEMGAESIRSGQQTMIEFIAKNPQAIIESPTGSGKSGVEYAILRACQSIGIGPRNIIVPTKTIAEQFKQIYPGLHVAFGRGENPCYYYNEEKHNLTPEIAKFKANEIPCSVLHTCPHRVDLETGETYEEGAIPCPYLLAKYEAKQNQGVTLSTFAYFVFNNLFGQDEKDLDGALVVDEAHRLADTLRSLLSTEISDYQLARSAEILQLVGGDEEAKVLRMFRKALVGMVMKRQPRGVPLLKEDEINKLIDMVEQIDYRKLQKLLKQAISAGVIDPKEDRETVRRLESLIRDVKRYVTAFRYSLPEGSRNPLNYIYAACEGSKEEIEEEGKKARCKLVVKCHYVAPLIKKMKRRFTMLFSATIGNPRTFEYETGIKFPFISIPSDFPVDRTAIYLPTDIADLSHKGQSLSRKEPNATMRRIARTAKEFRHYGYRSLVVVVSEAERQKFQQLATDECGEGTEIITYSESFKPKEVAQAFKDGVGDILLGTESNFGEGVDLPGGICPVIFVLRPGYPSPTDPGAIFEERRFGSGGVWGVRQHRVVIKALQNRGRNIRSANDRGVTFFCSEQFRGFLRHNLPAWLQDAYQGRMKWDECFDHALTVLRKK